MYRPCLVCRMAWALLVLGQASSLLAAMHSDNFMTPSESFLQGSPIRPASSAFAIPPPQGITPPGPTEAAQGRQQGQEPEQQHQQVAVEGPGQEEPPEGEKLPAIYSWDPHHQPPPAQPEPQAPSVLPLGSSIVPVFAPRLLALVQANLAGDGKHAQELADRGAVIINLHGVISVPYGAGQLVTQLEEVSRHSGFVTVVRDVLSPSTRTWLQQAEKRGSSSPAQPAEHAEAAPTQGAGIIGGADEHHTEEEDPKEPADPENDPPHVS